MPMLDLLKNKIILAYTVVLLIISFGVLIWMKNATKGVLSLMISRSFFIPLVSIIFSTIYVYNSSEFLELLVAQPLKRKMLWLSIFTGLTLSLSVAFPGGYWHSCFAIRTFTHWFDVDLYRLISFLLFSLLSHYLRQSEQEIKQRNWFICIDLVLFHTHIWFACFIGTVSVQWIPIRETNDYNVNA